MMEGFARDAGTPLGELSAEDLELLWERAKAQSASEGAPSGTRHDIPKVVPA
jgi:hypothetical protein